MPDDYPNQGNVDVEGAEEGVHPHHNLLGHCVGGGYIAAKLDEDPVIHHQDKLNKSVKTKDKEVIRYLRGLKETQLDLAFNNVKPKDRYFVLDKVQVRTELGCERLTNQNFWLDESRESFFFPRLLSF